MSDLINITIAVPADMVADANALARCVGYSADDERTFGDPAWQDAEGHAYSVASGGVKRKFLDDALAPLTEPEWGADLVAANRAQALLVVALPGDEVQPVDPEHISAVAGMDGLAAIAMLGLTRIPSEA